MLNSIQASNSGDAARRFLGVTVQPMYFQSEGLDAVLDSLAGTCVVVSGQLIDRFVDGWRGGDGVHAGCSE